MLVGWQKQGIATLVEVPTVVLHIAALFSIRRTSNQDAVTGAYFHILDRETNGYIGEEVVILLA